MRQVTIYLDEDTATRARNAARSEGVSLVLDLEGAWPDFPEIHELRRRF